VKNTKNHIITKKRVFLFLSLSVYVYLKRWIVAVYVPHMSILYGDLTEREKKKALEKAYTLDSSLDGLNFKINRVALWITDADVGSWVKVDEHTLIS